MFGQNPDILKKEWILDRGILMVCLPCRKYLLGNRALFCKRFDRALPPTKLQDGQEE
jgi:hypothetical protein